MRTLILATVTSAVVAAGMLTAPSSVAATPPTIRVNHHTVVQSDPVSITGHARSKSVPIYRKIGRGGWHRIATAHPKHGSYRLSTRPPAGRVTKFRAGAGRPATVHSARCTPLAQRGHVEMWREDLSRVTTLPGRWAQLICSAAPHSTITLALMFVFNDSPWVARLVAALHTVHTYRGVHVQVLLQHLPYYPTAKRYAAVKRLFSFASLRFCTYGCHSSSRTSHAHAKFMLVSKTVFGRAAVLESTSNWSKSQFTGERESGVYVYGNTALNRAFAAEWTTLVKHRPLSRLTWRAAGWGLFYEFGPHPATTDPWAQELARVRCRRGDTIGVVNVMITRPAVVRELNRLRTDGCLVRAIRRDPRPVRSAKYEMRLMHLHDKFVVISAHTAAGRIYREVITGSEYLTTSALVESDQQALLIRRTDMWAAYHGWFRSLWVRSSPAPTPAAARALVRAEAHRSPQQKLSDQ